MKKLLICVLLLVLFAYPASADVVVTGVMLDKQSITLKMGGRYDAIYDDDYLTENVMPEDATNKNVIWSSSNEEVVTVWVTASGRCSVEGVSPGSADITVTTEDGGFTAICSVNVIASDVLKTTVQYSSSKSEAAAKTPGFNEDDFEVVDGHVTVKKSIVENVAKKLLGTDNIEVSLLPWYEAKIELSGQNGKIAGASPSPTVLDRTMLKIKTPYYPDWEDEVLLLNIITPEAGEFLKYTWTEADYTVAYDGEFTLFPLQSANFVESRPLEDRKYELRVYIKDGGKYDLDKTENGSVVGQIAIVGKTEPQEEDSGGCNTGYGSLMLLLFGLAYVGSQRSLQ